MPIVGPQKGKSTQSFGQKSVLRVRKKKKIRDSLARLHKQHKKTQNETPLGPLLSLYITKKAECKLTGFDLSGLVVCSPSC